MLVASIAKLVSGTAIPAITRVRPDGPVIGVAAIARKAFKNSSRFIELLSYNETQIVSHQNSSMPPARRDGERFAGAISAGVPAVPLP